MTGDNREQKTSAQTREDLTNGSLETVSRNRTWSGHFNRINFFENRLGVQHQLP